MTDTDLSNLDILNLPTKFVCSTQIVEFISYKGIDLARLVEEMTDTRRPLRIRADVPRQECFAAASALLDHIEAVKAQHATADKYHPGDEIGGY